MTWASGGCADSSVHVNTQACPCKRTNQQLEASTLNHAACTVGQALDEDSEARKPHQLARNGEPSHGRDDCEGLWSRRRERVRSVRCGMRAPRSRTRPNAQTTFQTHFPRTDPSYKRPRVAYVHTPNGSVGILAQGFAERGKRGCQIEWRSTRGGSDPKRVVGNGPRRSHAQRSSPSDRHPSASSPVLPILCFLFNVD